MCASARYLTVAAVCAALTTITQANPTVSTVASRGEAALTTDSVLVKFRSTAPPSARAALHRAMGMRRHRTIEPLNIDVLRVPRGRSIERVLALYRDHPQVAYAEENRKCLPALLPNDPSYSRQWHLPQIGAPAAWDSTIGDRSVIVAVLDTGVDSSVPELTPAVIPGWNVFDDNADTSDVLGHGTRMSGIIAAEGNNADLIASVAWGCSIMPIRITNTMGIATDATIAAGLVWAADHGARVATISFELLESATMTDAAQYFQSAGGVVILAAGNSGIVLNDPENPYIIKISATDTTDTVPSWSNTGAAIDFAAPGTSIVTITTSSTTASSSGTSAAAPIVAGVAALVLSANPGLTAGEVEQVLRDSAEDFGPAGWDPAYGWGRINAEAAVQLALGSGGGDTVPPSVDLVSPAPGSTLANTILVQASASDNVGVANVDLFVNGTFFGRDSSAPYEWTVDTTTLPNGACTLEVVATDTADNASSPASIGIFIDNQTPCDCPSDCSEVQPSEVPGVTCADGVDNDCDGAVDCADRDCLGALGCPDCLADADCDDGQFCNGTEACSGGSCLAGAPIDCNDGVGCTVDRCIEATRSCDHTPDDSLCDNGAFCDGLESCDPVADCQSGTAPCAGQFCVEASQSCVDCLVDADCDDGNACTTNLCDNGTCVDEAVLCDDGNACTDDACDPTAGCQFEPVVCPQGYLCQDGFCALDPCNRDGLCQVGENCDNCPSDCDAASPVACGNGVCEAAHGEDCLTCPQDCNGVQNGQPSGRFCCGGGGGDGAVGCNDSRCVTDPYQCRSEPVVDWCCGDGVCEGDETETSCGVDCSPAAWCGDGLCDGEEDSCNCAVDCGTPPVAESDRSACSDGLDNDCDGAVDCDDSDCMHASNCIACDNDGVCEADEDCRSCPKDCSGAPGDRINSSYCCGNGVVEMAEGDGSICDGNY